MKRILIISGYASFILLMAFTSTSAQEVKTEKNIKVIIVDDSGNKTVIDTLINNSTMSDTINLGKAKIIVVDDSGHKRKGGKEHITVTVLSDEDDSLKMSKDVRVISSDSMNWTDSED